MRHRLLDARRVVAAVGADHRHPCRRGVVVAEDLHELALLQDVHLRSAPGCVERRCGKFPPAASTDQIVRQSAVASDGVGGRLDRRAQGAGVGDDGITVEMCIGHLPQRSVTGRDTGLRPRTIRHAMSVRSTGGSRPGRAPFLLAGLALADCQRFLPYWPCLLTADRRPRRTFTRDPRRFRCFRT